MEVSFIIMAVIAACLLIMVFLFWFTLIGFVIYRKIEHKKRVKERQKEV